MDTFDIVSHLQIQRNSTLLFLLLLQDSAENKDFTEKTYKREAVELRKVVEEKSEEIEQLKNNLKEALDVSI